MAFDFVKGEVLFLYKPYRWTSFDLVRNVTSVIRKQLHFKPKVGHAGTLDPLATGLMIICTGQQTKQIFKYQDLPKVYAGKLKLGETTPSYDKETQVDQTFDISGITEKEIMSAVAEFIGEIDQVPPIYSAVKKEGMRSYDLARRGKKPVLESRKVMIYDFKITEICMPFVSFEVKCSKGTYIRTLVNDFGKALHNGALLVELERTMIGDYSIKECMTPEQFTEKLKSESISE
jgi:tRNA pseudouridine55 synthase